MASLSLRTSPSATCCAKYRTDAIGTPSVSSARNPVIETIRFHVPYPASPSRWSVMPQLLPTFLSTARRPKNRCGLADRGKGNAGHPREALEIRFDRRVQPRDIRGRRNEGTQAGLETRAVPGQM